MGEPAGIGGEIALKAWLARENGLPPFFLVDDAARLRALAGSLGLPVPVRTVSDADDARCRLCRGLAGARPAVAAPGTSRPTGPGKRDRGNRRDRDGGDPRPLRRGLGRGHQSHSQEGPLRGRLPLPRSHRVPGGARRRRLSPGDDAGLRRPSGGAGDGPRQPQAGDRDAANGRHRRQRNTRPTPRCATTSASFSRDSR